MARVQKNEFEISGRVHFVGMPVEYEGKRRSFKKRVLVLEVFARGRRNEVPFEFVDDNMEMLDMTRKGDWVTITFLLRGNHRVQQDGLARWFTNLEGIGCVTHRG